MEILSSGSFINLENQDKIEQLKYTAHELANAASSTAGFVNEEDVARKLALEFWQGLEYMCRETEQTSIQNIFTGEFLERLRELRPVPNVSELVQKDEVPNFVAEPEVATVTAEDEFLGVLAPENQETEAENQEIPMSTEDLSSMKSDFTETVEIESVELVEYESDSTQSAEDDSEITETDLPEMEVEAKEIEVSDSLSLPEKEPYQFNKCTVTATIQLLPVIENSDSRKAVLSVKTHDFAPQYSLVEVSTNELTASLAPEIEKVLAKYQADLPFKVMDKMKKEKAAPKRNSPKISTETKSVSQTTVKSKETVASQNTQPSTITTPAPQPAETGAQGSLFAL
jgi:hypothetical protein